MLINEVGKPPIFTLDQDVLTVNLKELIRVGGLSRQLKAAEKLFAGKPKVGHQPSKLRR